MADSLKEALRSVQSIAMLFVVVTATVALIGLSKDRADTYVRAAAALDSLPAYPCALDTDRDPSARRFAEAVAKLDSVLQTLDPLSGGGTPFVSAHGRPDGATQTLSSELVPFGTRIALASDRTISSRIGFLEGMRSVVYLAAPNMDSLSARGYAGLQSLKPPAQPLTIDFLLDPSDTAGAWMDSGLVHVKVLVHVTRDSTRHLAPSVAAWRDSYAVTVPANLGYLAAVQAVSWRMTPYFLNQRWLENRQLAASVRWADYRKHILQPLSPAALALTERVKPVLLEVAEMELPAARRFIRERADALSDRGSVTILGLTLESGVAIWIVPLIFTSLALLVFLHLLHLLQVNPSNENRNSFRSFPWAPLFVGWKGTVAGAVMFVLYPVAAALLFTTRMLHVEHSGPPVAVIAVGVLAAIASFVTLAVMRGRAGRPMKERLTVGSPAEWEYFQSKYPELLRHVPHVVALAERALDKPVNFEEPLSKVMYGLTKMCVEEFMEIIVLCGNGYGIGGLKLVRTLYENAVTARHLHLNPADVEPFLDYLFVSEKKILDAIERETKKPTPPELREEADRQYERVKGQFEIELCPECHRRGMNFRWSKLDFIAMASKAKGLEDLVIPAYRDALRYTHAGVGGLFARMEGNAEDISYRSAPHHEEAASALRIANDIVLRVIAHYIEHFQIEGLNEEFDRCIKEYVKVWNVDAAAGSDH